MYFFKEDLCLFISGCLGFYQPETTYTFSVYIQTANLHEPYLTVMNYKGRYSSLTKHQGWDNFSCYFCREEIFLLFFYPPLALCEHLLSWVSCISSGWTGFISLRLKPLEYSLWIPAFFLNWFCMSEDTLLSYHWGFKKLPKNIGADILLLF